MPAKDFGTKHTCFKCGTRFYDMKKPAPLCPKCGSDQREGPGIRSPPPPEKRRAPPKPAVEPVAEVAEEDLEEDAEEPADEGEPAESDES